MADHAAPKSGIKLSNKAYDVVHHTVVYVLPALGTFYWTIAAIWDLLYAEQVVGTIAALTTLLAVVIGLSRRTYKNDDSNFDGALVVDGVRDIMQLDVQTPLDQMAQKDVIQLKVKQEPESLTSVYKGVEVEVTDDEVGPA